MSKQPKTGRPAQDGHRVVVLGAGYTGMLAAIRPAHRTRRTGVQGIGGPGSPPSSSRRAGAAT
ncbi:hypothetical protein [Streptomyces sp. NPDC001165]|uniref:hypothetical protein n=1 Tax=Streptomyces sp. NPDC001165 TaxID=3364546 RepID=UPI0036BC5432